MSSSSSSQIKQKFSLIVIGIAAGYLLHAILKRMKTKRINLQKEDIKSPRSCTSHDGPNNNLSESDMLISALNLQCHPEGGWFRTTYKSGCSDPMKSKGKTDLNGWIWDDINNKKKRNLMSSIYWLQRESDSKIMSLHSAGCDIVHYFHHGTGLKYFIVDPILNTLMTTTLGPNVQKGHGFQLIVPKHCWIAAIIDNNYHITFDFNEHHQNEHDMIECGKYSKKEKFALISEACCPGFDFRDWRLISLKEILDTNLSDNDKDLLRKFVHKSIDSMNTDHYY